MGYRLWVFLISSTFDPLPSTLFPLSRKPHHRNTDLIQAENPLTLIVLWR